MTNCEFLTGCVFFNDKMTLMPATADLLKKKLCHGDKDECARYLVAKNLGRTKTPGDLYPNDMARARSLIDSK